MAVDPVKKFEKDIITKMKAVNTYHKSFDHAIKVLAKTLFDYDETMRFYQENGSNMLVEHTNKNGSTNIVKSPVYLAIEKLRDDILAYSKELGLTPAGLTRLNDELNKTNNPKSKLANALAELDKL